MHLTNGVSILFAELIFLTQKFDKVSKKANEKIKMQIIKINFFSASPTHDETSPKFTWWKHILYQIIFTISLSVYFGLCLYGYLSTLDSFSPRIVRSNRNPSLMFRPLPKHPYSTLIHFTHGGSGNWKHYKVNYTTTTSKICAILFCLRFC